MTFGRRLIRTVPRRESTLGIFPRGAFENSICSVQLRPSSRAFTPRIYEIVDPFVFWLSSVSRDRSSGAESVKSNLMALCPTLLSPLPEMQAVAR